MESLKDEELLHNLPEYVTKESAAAINTIDEYKADECDVQTVANIIQKGEVHC